MSSRPFVLPSVVLQSDKTDKLTKNTIFVAYSDMFGRFPLTFQAIEVQNDQRTWSVFQYDRESCNSECVPRDMIFGFCVLPSCPFWSQKGGAQAAFERYTSKQWPESMKVPSLDKLSRLKATSYLMDGMWIILVRTPRPVGSRNVIPFVRRKDVVSLQAEMEISENPHVLEEKLRILQDKNRWELPHPTEAQLFLTSSHALVQGVANNILCVRCGARGHHMSHTHDEVHSKPNEAVQCVWPDWMNIKPLPAEKLDVPTTDETKGFKIEIRNVVAHIPLRLARQLKLRGVEVEGEIEKCGVMEET